jgi:protein-L-isoaspartate(D-aspartate) O-methyltransferase
MTDFVAERDRMVERQIERRGITDERLLDAFRAVPREEFVPGKLREFAYEDGPLPIEADQTISQPYIVALMIEAAGIAEGDLVLEIGAGSGYAAAVMAQIAARVFAVERHEELARLADERMRALGYANVVIRHGDGSRGWIEESPFDAILAAASGSHVPEALKQQLAIRGVLVMPVGEPQAVQKLVKVSRTGGDRWREEDLGQVRFVPLVEAQGV